MRHRPDLLGELMDLEPPERDDVEALKTFFEQIQKREKIAAEIADDVAYWGYVADGNIFSFNNHLI